MNIKPPIVAFFAKISKIFNKFLLFGVVLTQKQGFSAESYISISQQVSHFLFKLFNVVFRFLSIVYLLIYFMWQCFFKFKVFIYILSIVTGTLAIFCLNLLLYLSQLIIFLVSRVWLLISYIFLLTGLIIVVNFFVEIVWAPIVVYLYLYQYLMNKMLYPLNYISYHKILYFIIVGFYISIREAVPIFLKFVGYILDNFNFFFYASLILFAKTTYFYLLLGLQKAVISCINLLAKLLRYVKYKIEVFVRGVYQLFVFVYTRIYFFFVNTAGFLWFRVTLSYPIQIVKFFLFLVRITLFLFFKYIEFVFWYYMICIYILIRVFLKIIYKVLMAGWMTLFYTISFIHSIKMFYMYTVDLYAYITTVSIKDAIVVRVQRVYINTIMPLFQIRISPVNVLRYIRGLNSFDILLLGIAGFHKLNVFVSWCWSIIKKWLRVGKRILLFILWPFLIVLRIIYSITRPFLKPFVVFWNFLVEKTLPLRNIIHYKSMFPKRSPIEELNQEEPANISENADFLNKNINNVLHPIFSDVLGDNLREFMFDSMEPSELFRNDFEFLETDQFSFVYGAMPNDYASQVHAEFYGILNMLSMEDILKEPNVAGYDPLEGAAFSRETFTILGFLESLVRSFSSVKEIGKEDFKEETVFIHLPDESIDEIDVPAGNALKKRIAWFLKYYKYLSKRFDLVMNGKLNDKSSSKEFLRKEKIFSKQYLRRHTFRRRLVFNSNKPGFLHLTPTFLNKVEDLLKKDLSEYFLVYGDPQFAVESRYSNRMLYHGILNLVVLFFIVVYVFIPDAEHVLFYRCVIITVMFITAWLLFLIYFSIFKRRTGLLSRKGLFLDGNFRLMSELVGGWAIIMFFLFFIYYWETVIIGWEAVDVKYLTDAYSNERVFFDWLINIMSEDDNFILDDYFVPLLSIIERSQMLNSGIWNGQFYNPCYILYAQDLRYIKETFISYAISHYIYLWQNVPSPIIAIIGDTCMLLKQRYSNCSVEFVAEFVKDLPSSFAVQNYLLDLKYKLLYSNLLKVDILIFKFLKENLSPASFEYICGLVESIAFYFAHLRLLLMLILRLDMQYASISFAEYSNVKMAHFSPQIKKLEEDILNKNVETITQGNFLEDVFTCLDAEIPEDFQDIKNFEYAKFFLTLFWYIFEFCFFDIYTLLGLPLNKPVGFILPEYFGEDIKDVAAGMLQNPSELPVREYNCGLDEDFNRSDNFLVSSHDLLDDYSTLEGDLHIKGHEFLKQCRFALSPFLMNNYNYSNSGDVGVWLTASSLRKMQLIARRLQDWAFLLEFITPWDRVVHSSHNLIDKSFRNYTDRYWFGFKSLAELVKAKKLEGNGFWNPYYIDLFARETRPWYALDNLSSTEFVIRSSYFGNLARFDLEYNGPDTLNFHMARLTTIDMGIAYDIYMPMLATDLNVPMNQQNLRIFWNWNNEDFFKYGGTMDEIETFADVQLQERQILGAHENSGGYLSNALFFYYYTLARCAYNESFFTQHYKYPLFYNISNNPSNFKDKCLSDYIKTNLLMCDRYNTGWYVASMFDREYFNNYFHLAAGSWDLCYSDLEDPSYHTVEVPSLPMGDIGVINRSANLFDMYFNNLLKGGSVEFSDNNIYLHLIAGDEYVIDSEYPFLYSKSYDGFIYYLIERNGKKFVIPLDIWLRDNVYFNDIFIPHYDVNQNNITMLPADQKYFKILTELDFEDDQRRVCLSSSIQCPTILLQLQEALLDGYMKEPSDVLSGVEALDPSPKTKKSLTFMERIYEMQTLTYWTTLYNEFSDKLSKFLVKEKSSQGVERLSEFIKYRKSYQVKLDNRGDTAEKLIAMYPFSSQVRTLPLIADEFKIVSEWWEDCNEYLWEIRDEIEEYGADDFCKKYHAGYLAYIRLYNMYMQETHYQMDPEPNPFEEWVDAINERKELNDAFYKIPIEITSPYLVQCKQELLNILNSEILNSAQKAEEICFYNFCTEAFKKLLNQSHEVQLYEYLGIYDLPKYSNPLLDFFDLNS